MDKYKYIRDRANNALTYVIPKGEKQAFSRADWDDIRNGFLCASIMERVSGVNHKELCVEEMYRFARDYGFNLRDEVRLEDCVKQIEWKNAFARDVNNTALSFDSEYLQHCQFDDMVDYCVACDKTWTQAETNLLNDKIVKRIETLQKLGGDSKHMEQLIYAPVYAYTHRDPKYFPIKLDSSCLFSDVFIPEQEVYFYLGEDYQKYEQKRDAEWRDFMGSFEKPAMKPIPGFLSENEIQEMESVFESSLYDEDGGYRDVRSFDRQELKTLRDTTWECYELVGKLRQAREKYESVGNMKRAKEFNDAIMSVDYQFNVLADFAEANGCKSVTTFKQAPHQDKFIKCNIVMTWMDEQCDGFESKESLSDFKDLMLTVTPYSEKYPDETVQCIEHVTGELIWDEDGVFRDVDTFDKKELRALSDAAWKCFDLYHTFDHAKLLYMYKDDARSELCSRAANVIDSHFGKLMGFAAANGCGNLAGFKQASDSHKREIRNYVREWSLQKYENFCDKEDQAKAEGRYLKAQQQLNISDEMSAEKSEYSL